MRRCSLPEGQDLGKTLNEAMSAIESENPDLKGILPKNYNLFDNSLLVELLKSFNHIPMATPTPPSWWPG